MAQDSGLDKELGRLYAAPPGQFVGLRDALARSLRKDGNRAAADDVKALRKPTVAAWAVNQLARREKMRLRGLLTAGERLRAVQEEVLEGAPPQGLERARDDERAAIGQLAAAAQALLAETGHPPTETVLERVRETLHAAAVDEAIGRRVREGRLEREEQATGFGFSSLPATAPARPARQAGRKGKREQKAASDGAGQSKRRRAEEAAGEKRRAVEERLRDARRALADAERSVKSRTRELEQAQRELDRCRTAMENAERAVERARTRHG